MRPLACWNKASLRGPQELISLRLVRYPLCIEPVSSDVLIRLNCRMGKLTDSTNSGSGWQRNVAQPSPLFGIGFAACCLALATARAVVVCR